MKSIRNYVLLALMISLVGCYHAKITTGLEPSNKVVEEPFAASFINGLVPPKPIDTEDQCTNGVAIVETELSFLNLVVGAVTFGIFTPMHLKVTCAASMSTLGIDEDHTDEYIVVEREKGPQVSKDIQDAAAEVIRKNKPVLLISK